MRDILNNLGIENFIYDLDHLDKDPKQNRDYFVDALPQIKSADQIWVLHNHHEDSIGMMMEIAAGYALTKPVVVRRKGELEKHKPYNMDQCAYKVMTYKDKNELTKQLQNYSKSLA